MAAKYRKRCRANSAAHAKQTRNRRASLRAIDTARLMVPFAVSGAGSAAIAASMTRWSLLGPLHGPVAVVVGTLAGAAVGVIIGRVALDRRSLLRVGGALALLGPLSGLAVAVTCEPGLLGLAIVMGTAIALALAPVLLASVWLLRRGGARRDTRAPLRLAGVWLSVASAIGLCLFSLLRRPFWTSEECVTLARVPVLLALVGCAIVFSIALLDGRAEDDLQHIELLPHLDPGGSWWLTYVGTPRPNARRGELERAHGLLAASRQSRIAIVLVLLAAAPTLLVYARLYVE